MMNNGTDQCLPTRAKTQKLCVPIVSGLEGEELIALLEVTFPQVLVIDKQTAKLLIVLLINFMDLKNRDLYNQPPKIQLKIHN